MAGGECLQELVRISTDRELSFFIEETHIYRLRASLQMIYGHILYSCAVFGSSRTFCEDGLLDCHLALGEIVSIHRQYTESSESSTEREMIHNSLKARRAGFRG